MDFTGKVAIVTGGGRGLGRQYCLELARRGARLVVNDLGTSIDGKGASDAAQEVVREIEAAGGTAIANGASVTDPGEMQAMAREAHERFGRIDLLVANAGILRDRSFAKMPTASSLPRPRPAYSAISGRQITVRARQGCSV